MLLLFYVNYVSLGQRNTTLYTLSRPLFFRAGALTTTVSYLTLILLPATQFLNSLV